MNSRFVKIVVLVGATLVLAIGAASIYSAFLHGVRHSSNYGSLFGLGFKLGGALSTLIGLGMTIVVANHFKRVSTLAFVGISVGLAGIVIPWLVWPMVPAMGTYSERRDFEAAGAEILRDAADQLVQSSKKSEYDRRWFGEQVPQDQVPEPIRNFIPEAAYVTVDDNGVVLVTDGMGGWRGGYMILPPGSSFVPEQSRYIADGFYYVTH